MCDQGVQKLLEIIEYAKSFDTDSYCEGKTNDLIRRWGELRFFDFFSSLSLNGLWNPRKNLVVQRRLPF